MNIADVEEELDLPEEALDYTVRVLEISPTAHLTPAMLGRIADFLTAHAGFSPATIQALRTLSSRGVVRLNNVPSESRPYFRYLLHAADVVAVDVCTEAARRVLARLGVGAAADRQDDVATYLKRNFNSWPNIQEGLYNLTISLDDGRIWQHGLVLMKQGNGLFLIQGWVGHYTVGQWLNPANPARIDDVCFAYFSPAGARFRVENMANWLGNLGQLHTALKADADRFEGTCRMLFGVEFGAVDKMAIGRAVGQPDRLKFAWKFQALNPR
jgi:hypothetical protein